MLYIGAVFTVFIVPRLAWVSIHKSTSYPSQFKNISRLAFLVIALRKPS